jgi:hypothetical protein
MRQLIRDRVSQIDNERVMNLTESYNKNEKVPPIIRRKGKGKGFIEGFP